MECEIFCLLALCAFQTVIADDSSKGVDDIYVARGETYEKFTPAFQTKQDNYMKAVNAVKPKGTESDKIAVLMSNCLAEVDESNKSDENFKTAAVKCDKYYNEADQTKDIKLADKGCDKIVADFMSMEKLNVDKAVECVTKCLQPGADCKNMFETN